MRYDHASHETLGSDLLAVLNTTKFPAELLGPYWAERLGAINATHWYPVSTQLELHEQVLHRGGRASLVQLGRHLFRDSHQARLAPALRTAGDVLHQLDSMYRFTNRGRNTGGWEVLGFTPGHAVMRKTTPHHCALDEGFLHEALQLVGTAAMIIQPTCALLGGKACELELQSPMRDHRWMGEYPAKIHASA